MKSAKILGEIDPSYCFYPCAIKRIKDQMSQDFKLKFIFVIRHPVYRAYSHYLMSFSRGYEKNDFEYAITQEQNRLEDVFSYGHYSYIKRGKYKEQIECYLKEFSGQQILYLIFEEDLKKDPSIVISKIHEFLGLKPFNYEFSIKSNEASEPKIIWSGDFHLGRRKIKTELKLLFPFEIIRKRLNHKALGVNSRKLVKAQLSNETTQKTWKSHYKGDVLNLETLSGRTVEICKTIR